MSLKSRSVGAALAAAGVVASASLLAPTAAADGPVAACHWINGEYYQTYSCDEPTDGVDTLDIVDCWNFPVSDRSFVQVKTTDGWSRSAEVTVKARGSRGCPEGYPYRTVVSIPGSMLEEMVPTRVQLVMPRTSVYKRTKETYVACLMPEGSLDWCPRR